MGPVLAITKRELKKYFTSVTAYIVIILFLMVAGGLFWLEFFSSVTTELSMRQFFGRAPFFLAFFAPAIAMGLLSEEQRSKTLELLMTLPVTDMQVVLGKFLAATTLLSIVLLATLPYAICLSTMGNLDWGPVIGGYVGLILLGAAYVSVGLLVSAWTKDQMVAILVGFFFCFALNIFGDLAAYASGWLQDVLTFISTSGHFQNISRGVIDLRDVAYYLSIIALCLVAASLTVSRRRW